MSAKRKPFTSEELMARAVARRDYKRHVQKMFLLTRGAYAADAVFDNRAPHAYRGTAPRAHGKRQPTWRGYSGRP